MTEKRKFCRIPFQCQTQVKSGKRTYAAELLDISMKGALVLMRDTPDWPTDHIAFLDIKLVNSDIHLQFEAKLAHREGTHYGFIFLSEDLETFTHLRRLLELNLGDAEIVEHELSDWMKG